MSNDFISKYNKTTTITNTVNNIVVVSSRAAIPVDAHIPINKLTADNISVGGNSITAVFKHNSTPTTIIVNNVGPSGANGIAEENIMYAKRVDFISSSLLYKGEAVVGALNSDALWRIRRISILSDFDVTEEWAFGNESFTNIWDNRTLLTYS